MKIDIAQIEQELGVEKKPALGPAVIALGVCIGVGLPLLALFAPFWPWGSAPAFATLGTSLLILGVATGLMGGGKASHASGPVYVSPIEDGGIVLGVKEDGTQLQWPTGVQPQHMLCIGAPSQGKSVLLKSLTWAKLLKGGAVVCLDAKPEDQTIAEYLWMAGRAPGRRHRIRIIAPDRPFQSNTLNPLQYGGVEEQVSLLTGLRRFEGSGTTEYYLNQQEDALAAVIIALLGTGKYYNMGDVQAALCSQDARQKLIDWPDNKGAGQLEMMLEGYRSNGQFDNKRWFYEMGGVITVLRKYIRTAGPILLCNRGEVDFLRVFKEGECVYVPLPTGTATKLAFSWALLLIKAASAAGAELIRQGFKPAEPALFECDEYAAYATQDSAMFLAQARAAYIGMVLGFQSASQLRGSHEDLEHKVMDNTLYKVFFSQGGAEGAKAAAEQIGYSVQLHKSYNLGSSDGTSSGGLRTTRSRGQNVGVSGREALNYKVVPDDIRSLPVGNAYVTWKGSFARVRTPLFSVPKDELPPIPDRSEKVKLAGDYTTDDVPGIGLWDEFRDDVDREMGRPS